MAFGLESAEGGWAARLVLGRGRVEAPGRLGPRCSRRWVGSWAGGPRVVVGQLGGGWGARSL